MRTVCKGLCINAIVTVIALVCSSCSADRPTSVITEEMVVITLDLWAEYANSGDVSALMALLSDDVIIQTRIPSGFRDKWFHPDGKEWIDFQIPRDDYEEIIMEARSADRVYSYVREKEQVEITDGGQKADSIAIIFERVLKGDIKECTKTTEEMSFRIMNDQLKIIRMTGIVWGSC